MIQFILSKEGLCEKPSADTRQSEIYQETTKEEGEGRVEETEKENTRVRLQENVDPARRLVDWMMFLSVLCFEKYSDNHCFKKNLKGY